MHPEAAASRIFLRKEKLLRKLSILPGLMLATSWAMTAAKLSKTFLEHSSEAVTKEVIVKEAILEYRCLFTLLH